MSTPFDRPAFVRSAFDVTVVGAGVVGAAVARHLAGFELSVALVDGRADVGDGTSKANTAILHTGFDADPGSLESTLVRRGFRLLQQYAPTVGIPIEPVGAILVAWNDEEVAALPALLDKAYKNEYPHCRILDAAQVQAALPNLGPGARAGLLVPDESIICPWTTPLAYATEAVLRGVDLRLEHQVTAIDVGSQSTVLQTSRGPIRTRWVVNAAGLGSDLIDQMLGHDRFRIVPRRGELLVFDKFARSLVDHIVLPVPTAKGKGVLVSPTIYGNVMLGPTAQDLVDRRDTSTSPEGFDFLLAKGRAIMPRLLQEEITAAYAGLRAATQHRDYVVDVDQAQRYLVLGGIRSTGLTASMALAEHAASLLQSAGLALAPRRDLPEPPRMPNLGEAFARPYQRADLIAEDPAYGEIVCFCERVSRGEIRDALGTVVPARDADGLRRRTRAMLGRCQGFWCGAEVDAMLRGAGAGS